MLVLKACPQGRTARSRNIGVPTTGREMAFTGCTAYRSSRNQQINVDSIIVLLNAGYVPNTQFFPQKSATSKKLARNGARTRSRLRLESDNPLSAVTQRIAVTVAACPHAFVTITSLR